MTQVWSTLTIARAAQFAYWRELICEAFLDLAAESELRDGFAGVVTQWSFGALSLARIESQRQHVRRTEHEVARAPRGGYYANLQVRGVSGMRQGDRVTVLRPGDLAVVYADQPFAFDFDTDFRQLSLFIPRPVLDAQLSGPIRTATRIDTTTGVGAAVRHAMTTLSRSTLPARSATRLAALTSGMLALAAEGIGPGARGGATSARSYRRALADIEEHLADDDLSPAATARRLGVSVRWLHGLFAGYELSYAATVRRMRLEYALRTLRDPGHGHLRVIDIAAEAGFGNVTSFHRAFRREFGRTPAQIRAESPAR
jgi:AraC-like DNA-binding protein